MTDSHDCFCSFLPSIEQLTGGQEPRPLSGREREIARLVALGYRNKEIAVSLEISEQTVKNNVAAIFRKLGVGDRVSLALYMIQKGSLS